MQSFIVLLALITPAACFVPANPEQIDIDLVVAARRNLVAGVKKALDGGADINAIVDESRQTPLMAATLAGSAACAKLLLERGANPNIGEMDGYTPPHGAGFQGRAALVPILNEAGIDLAQRHDDGYAGIHRACWGTSQRHVDTIVAFIDAGIDVDYPTADGRTCWEITKDPGIKALLEEQGARRKPEEL